MSFDNSRFTFNPWNDYLGVVMQQGRVQLDSDWNEWLAEFARRIQAGTLDILGLAGVPSTTPYGFKIKAYPSGQQITIGTGRIYVDGLMVENHGSIGGAQWDSALAEWSGAPPGAAESDVPDYINQPYLPGATVPGNGPFLVYLDVWQREVTYLEDVNLVDKAVGVDTTGRLQTVWQVKLLDVSGVPGGVNCWMPDSTIEQATIWGYLVQPSPSLLTNGVVQLAPSGPCALNPATGYTGLENQLYRVEIHQGGGAAASGSVPLPTGTATFKWSREDASVATAVTGISNVTNSVGATASQLTVQSTGRDQVLGFNPGDWIEIIDDYLELNPPVTNGQAQPGELHKIDSINSAANTITLDSTVSSVRFPVNSANQTDPSRHTRIRRWDQAGTVYQSDGATVWVDLDSVNGNTGIPVPPSGTALILENGITVTFDLASSGSAITPWNNATSYSSNAPASVVSYLGAAWIAVAPVTGTAPGVVSGQWAQLGFRTGDFWTFAARTADGSVQNLTKASPVGIQHHYCRLGIVNFNQTPAFSDSRQIFPSLANPCIHITSIQVASTGTPIQNDTPITVQQLAGGISIICNAPLDPAIVTAPAAQSSNCPICFVTADLPIPSSPPSGGFNPFILSATVSVSSNAITWTPTAAAEAALLTHVFPGGLPLLARLTLKGNFIWAQGNSGVYLNGAILGVPGTATGGGGSTSLQLPSGDGRRSADFEMWFWLTSQPAVTLSASAINFFTPQLVGSPSSPQSVTLTNNGTTTLTFPGTGISVGGPNAGDFKVTNTCGTSVAAKGNCTITVTFTPTAAGTRTASISIQESADPSPLLIPLTGTGIQPLVSASVSSLVFAAQTVGTTSAPQTVTLTNPGSSQLNISSISVEGEATDFPLTNLCGVSLQPNQSCTISVEFEPTAAGTLSATLRIVTNATNVANGPLLISLSGTGVAAAPGISVSPTSWNFGVVLTISSSTKAFTLTSTGNAALTITQMAITGTIAGNFNQTSNCGGTLQPGQQCTIDVVFKPAGAGLQTAQLEIFHNAGGSPLIVPLSGTGEIKGKDTKETKDTKEAVLEKATTIEKIKETVLPEVKASSSPDISAHVTGGSGTQAAFITPQERPSVGPQA